MSIIVYIPGVWDLLHVGHLEILERAKALGDKLVVGVPSDSIVKVDKGMMPIVRMEDRMRILSALRVVDVVIPYYHLEFLTHLNMVKPDLLVVGETWGNDSRHLDAEAWAACNGCRLVKMPYYLHESTTQIKKRISRNKSKL